MIYHHIEQGTDEWLNIRAKKITASVASMLFAKPRDPKMPFGIAAMTAFDTIVAERCTGITSVNSFYSKATERGKFFEDEARTQYKVLRFCKLTQIGFVESDDGTYGCSPDSLVDDDGDLGLLEIKVYSISGKHVKTAEGKNNEHKIQLQFQLYCCQDRAWNDHMSYYPENPEGQRRVIMRHYPDYDLFKQIEYKLKRAEEVIQEKIYNFKNSPILS